MFKTPTEPERCVHCDEDIGLSWAPQGDPDTAPGFGWADGMGSIRCRNPLTNAEERRHRPKVTACFSPAAWAEALRFKYVYPNQ